MLKNCKKSLSLISFAVLLSGDLFAGYDWTNTKSAAKKIAKNKSSTMNDELFTKMLQDKKRIDGKLGPNGKKKKDEKDAVKQLDKRLKRQSEINTFIKQYVNVGSTPQARFVASQSPHYFNDLFQMRRSHFDNLDREGLKNFIGALLMPRGPEFISESNLQKFLQFYNASGDNKKKIAKMCSDTCSSLVLGLVNHGEVGVAFEIAKHTNTVDPNFKSQRLGAILKGSDELGCKFLMAKDVPVGAGRFPTLYKEIDMTPTLMVGNERIALKDLDASKMSFDSKVQLLDAKTCNAITKLSGKTELDKRKIKGAQLTELVEMTKRSGYSKDFVEMVTNKYSQNEDLVTSVYRMIKDNPSRPLELQDVNFVLQAKKSPLALAKMLKEGRAFNPELEKSSAIVQFQIKNSTPSCLEEMESKCFDIESALLDNNVAIDDLEFAFTEFSNTTDEFHKQFVEVLNRSFEKFAKNLIGRPALDFERLLGFFKYIDLLDLESMILDPVNRNYLKNVMQLMQGKIDKIADQKAKLLKEAIESRLEKTNKLEDITTLKALRIEEAKLVNEIESSERTLKKFQDGKEESNALCGKNLEEVSQEVGKMNILKDRFNRNRMTVDLSNKNTPAFQEAIESQIKFISAKKLKLKELREQMALVESRVKSILEKSKMDENYNLEKALADELVDETIKLKIVNLKDELVLKSTELPPTLFTKNYSDVPRKLEASSLAKKKREVKKEESIQMSSTSGSLSKGDSSGSEDLVVINPENSSEEPVRVAAGGELSESTFSRSSVTSSSSSTSLGSIKESSSKE